jgi:hypothetical protein
LNISAGRGDFEQTAPHVQAGQGVVDLGTDQQPFRLSDIVDGG